MMQNDLVNVTADELLLLSEGELDAESRSDLLRRLDEHPAQWRACALQLMETNALARSFQQLELNTLAPLVDRSPPALAHTPTARGLSRGLAFGAATTVALLLAVLVGVSIGRSQVRPTMHGRNVARRAVQDTQESTARTLQAQRMLDRLRIGDEKLIAVVELHDAGRRIHVPVIESQKLAQHLIANPVANVGGAELRAANRMGWHVTQQRQLLAIEDRNRQVQVVPLGLVRIKSVGRDLF